MARRVEMDSAVQEYLLTESNLPDKITLQGEIYRPRAPAGYGHKSVVWKVSNDAGRPRAIKLTTYDDFLARSAEEEQVYASRLENDQAWFARIERAGTTMLAVRGFDQRFVFFVQEWIEGESLRDFLSLRRDDVDTRFFMWYATTIMRPVRALAAADLVHDDLHAGNVMLSKPAASDFDGGLRLKIVDMGSLKPLDQATKDKHDLDQVCEHLVAIHNIVIEDGRATRRERRFLGEMRRILEQITDPDPERALRDPRRIYDACIEADSRSRHRSAEGGRANNSPFEFISSEHIADDGTFLDLFAEAPWLGDVANRDPCLLTGPRGCGKSTLFRWLSLKTQLARPEPDLDRLEIAGFYISCSVELEGRFSWIKTREQASDHEHALVSYFNLVLMREVLDTLLAMKRHEAHSVAEGDTPMPWSIGRSEEDAILEYVRVSLFANTTALAGVGGIEQAFQVVERERWRGDIALRRGEPWPEPTPTTLLGDFTALLVRLIPFFADRRIAFLVDDFTARRVNRHVQVVLNQVIRLRRSSLLFKVSSEKRGMEMTDSTGAPLDVSRELEEIDIGRKYVDLTDTGSRAAAHEFALKLLNHRLMVAGWTGRGETLLGHSGWGEYGSLSRALRNSPGRSQYHGLECIADLCSGDVSTLLLIYRRILRADNTDENSSELISKATQHGVITTVSREQVGLLRTHVPSGPAMHQLVSEFGTFVSNVLRNGRMVRQTKTRTVPPTCPRLEVDDAAEVGEQLSEELAALADELIRRAVFIEMEEGRGRHGNVQTLQWQLRRIYLPAFLAALDKNTPISLTPGQFKFLLNRPAEAVKTWYPRFNLDPDQTSLPIGDV